MALSQGTQRHKNVKDLSRRYVVFGLGVLWLFDGLLQLQPAMFTQYFANNPNDVIGNAFQSLPHPLYLFSMNFLIHYLSPHMVFWNSLAAGIQILLGIILILADQKVRKVGLILSVTWGILVWVFGEGMGGIFAGSMTGGVFPGTPSILNGFPGAAMVYSLISVLLLLPDRFWNVGYRYSAVRIAPGFLFIALAAIQLSPLLWTTFGQASIFAANADNLPSQLSFTLAPLIVLTASHPLLSNLVEMGITLFVGISLLVPTFKWSVIAALAWLAFIWWFGLGFGGLFSGSGTDPNTPPVIALLLIPIIVWLRMDGSVKRDDDRKFAPNTESAKTS